MQSLKRLIKEIDSFRYKENKVPRELAWPYGFQNQFELLSGLAEEIKQLREIIEQSRNQPVDSEVVGRAKTRLENIENFVLQLQPILEAQITIITILAENTGLLIPMTNKLLPEEEQGNYR